MDMNGDGIIDSVVADDRPGDGSPCPSSGVVWDVRLGFLNADESFGFESQPTEWCVPEFMGNWARNVRDQGEDPGFIRADTFDLNGDGFPDRINAAETPWHVYLGGCLTPNTTTDECDKWGFADPPIVWDLSPQLAGTPSLQNFNSNGELISTTIDMNGDGLPDFVHTNNSTTWSIYYNTGRRFEATATPFSAPFTYIPGENNRAMVDFDGDGLMDIVAATVDPGFNCLSGNLAASCLRVYRGGQDGIEASPDNLWAAAWQKMGYQPTSGPRSVSEELIDVSGDGLPDLVSASFDDPNEWTVQLNVGGELEPLEFEPSTWDPDILLGVNPRVWPGGGGVIRREKGYVDNSHVGVVDMIDMNGDGFLDRVEVELDANDEPTGQWFVRLARHVPAFPALGLEAGSVPKPHIMALMKNEMGGENTIRYGRSTLFDNTGGDGVPDLPFVQWMVTGTRLNDGRCKPNPWVNKFDPAFNPCIEDSNGVGHEVISRYHYTGGKLVTTYDPSSRSTEREFRGFQVVVTGDLVGGLSSTYFHQSYELKGRIEAVDQWAFAPPFNFHLVAKEENDWGAYFHPHNNSRRQIRLKTATMYRYDHGATDPHVSATENISVDAYGRITHSAKYGLIGTTIVDRVDSYVSYATPSGTDFRPYDKPMIASTGTGATTMERKSFYYDGATTLGSVSSGNLTQVRSYNSGGLDPIAKMEYDGYGNLVKVTDPEGNVTLTDYDDGHGTFFAPVISTACNGDCAVADNQYRTVTALSYLTGQTWIEIGPGGIPHPFGADNMVVTSFDEAGRAICTSLPGDTGCTTETTYDFADGTPGSLSTVTVREKWETGRPLRETVSSFDALGRQVRTEVQSIVDGVATTVVQGDVDYDKAGRMLRRYHPYEATAGGPYSRANGFDELDYHLNGTNYEDPLRRVWKVTFADSTSSRTEYRGLDTVTYDQEGVKTVSTMDTFERVITTTVYKSDGTPYSTNESEYDDLGRLTLVRQNGNVIKSIGYDELGRKTRVFDFNSGHTGSGWGFGVWKYTYDRAGNLLVQDDPEQDRHIQYTYDGLNRVTAKCYRSVDYVTGDPTGCPQDAYAVEQIDYEYDNPADPHCRGRLWRVTDAAGVASVEDYDPRGQQITMVRDIDIGGLGVLTTAQTSYDYTNSGEIKRIYYPGDDGEYVDTEFDDVGQPTGLVSFDGGGVLKDRYVTSASYDIFGRVAELEHGNGQEAAGQPANYSGVIDKRSYHDQSELFRLSGIKSELGATSWVDTGGYSYNDRGQLTGVTDNLNTGVPLTNDAAYTYDHYGRLASYDNGVVSRTYTYNEMGNITQKGALTFTYDPDEPHRMLEVHGLAGGVKTLEHDRNGNRTHNHNDQDYQYDHEDRLVEVTSPSGDPVSFRYDADGTRRARIVHTGVAGTTKRVTRYFSDLVHTTADGKTVRRYFLGGTLIASREIDDDAWQVATAPVIGAEGSPIEVAVSTWQGKPVMIMGLSPVAQGAGGVAMILLLLAAAAWPQTKRQRVVGLRIRNGQVVILAVLFLVGSTPWPLLVRPAQAQTGPSETVRHFHLDHLGSTLMITDEDGSPEEHIRYYPYGEVRGRFDQLGNPIGVSSDSVKHEFTGHETELNTGLIYAGARFLDPITATFLTQDPAAEFLNPYTYTGWDPVNLTDPTGEFAIGAALLAVGKFIAGNFWWIAPTVAVVGSVAQTLANGGTIEDAVGAGIVALFSAVVTGGILGGIGAALPASAVLPYKVALFSAGVGGVAYGASEGQYIAAVAGALVIAAGLLASYANWVNSLDGKDFITHLDDPTPVEEIPIKAPGPQPPWDPGIQEIRLDKIILEYAYGTVTGQVRLAQEEHTKGARPSSRGKHQKGNSRRGRDRGGEKGDKMRGGPRKSPLCQ